MTKIAQIIEEKGLRKGFIAQKAKISASAMSKILSGETKEPKLRVAIRLARVLNTTVEELWGHLLDEEER
ncbi:helix-turn-helix transcriptional regulator [Pullulanibacillus sp. KACC 23026]|uniref:helix-turn-helix domain-containing protein n=1 Tax=Pullulanibacillus sp. KACC 23026 TaxID=3028315 RepID=UPI0023B03A2B|nr:helix-turn-helix transcriptional regulator [Pullulanibacillus sp. KACC 23026]WEG14021.1 helix-turn-helix transcriptional regulator [Pullulanibacillus sp. KACC 23026]